MQTRLTSKRLKDIKPGDFVAITREFQIVVTKNLINDEKEVYDLVLVSANDCKQITLRGHFSVIHTWIENDT